MPRRSCHSAVRRMELSCTMEEMIVAEKTPLGNVTKSTISQSTSVHRIKRGGEGYRIRTKHHKSQSTISNNILPQVNMEPSS